jgi:hypothetical protein
VGGDKREFRFSFGEKEEMKVWGFGGWRKKEKTF